MPNEAFPFFIMENQDQANSPERRHIEQKLAEDAETQAFGRDAADGKDAPIDGPEARDPESHLLLGSSGQKPELVPEDENEASRELVEEGIETAGEDQRKEGRHKKATL